MKPWNTKTSIANDDIRIVKFFFETSSGPGHVTALVNKGVSIEEAKEQLLLSLKDLYEAMEIVKYEIIEIISE